MTGMRLGASVGGSPAGDRGLGLLRGALDAEWTLMGIGALLLTVAQPPFELVVPAFVCQVPAALLILRGASGTGRAARARKLLTSGFLYGAVTHAVLLHWLAWALWSIRPMALALFPLAVVAFGCLYGVLFLAVGCVVRRVPAMILVAFPAGLTVLEWAAAHAGPLAFPWFSSALTVASAPVLLQAADVLGSEGLGFVLMVVNAAVALAWSRRSRPFSTGLPSPAVAPSWARPPGSAFPPLATAGALVLLLVTYGAFRSATVRLEPGATVAVIQPNATPREKGDPEAGDALVQRTLRLTEESVRSSAPHLVVWPETALPDALPSRPDRVATLNRVARQWRTTLLVGGVDTEPEDGAPHATRRYNAAFAFPSRHAGVEAVYRKRRLVPMVETAALGRGIPIRDGAAFHPGTEGSLGSAPAGRYGTLLCFELTFPGMSRALRREGADVLVTLSNDAWLGRTLGPHQHFAHARLRAVETRTPVVRAANSGISGIVDPLGRVVARTALLTEGHAEAPLYRTPDTPLSLLVADWVGPAALLLLAMLLAWTYSSPPPQEPSRRPKEVGHVSRARSHVLPAR